MTIFQVIRFDISILYLAAIAFLSGSTLAVRSARRRQFKAGDTGVPARMRSTRRVTVAGRAIATARGIL